MHLLCPSCIMSLPSSASFSTFPGPETLIGAMCSPLSRPPRQFGFLWVLYSDLNYSAGDDSQVDTLHTCTPCNAATVVQLCTFDDYLCRHALWPAGLVGRGSTGLSSGLFSGIKWTVWELAEAVAAQPQNCHTCFKWTRGHGWRFEECTRLNVVRYGPKRVTSSGCCSSLVSRAARQVDLTWNTVSTSR